MRVYNDTNTKDLKKNTLARSLECLTNTQEVLLDRIQASALVFVKCVRGICKQGPDKLRVSFAWIFFTHIAGFFSREIKVLRGFFC